MVSEKEAAGVCLGVDLHRDGWPAFFAKEIERVGPEKFFLSLVRFWADFYAGQITTMKFQSAFYEEMGALGYNLLRSSLQIAHNRGYSAILDGKRGDITSTMAAYGRSAFEHLAADALTVTPYMGTAVVSALSPWLKRGKKIYIVLLSSNAEGSSVQNVTVYGRSSRSKMLYEHVFYLFAEKAEKLGVEKQIGFVVGIRQFSSLESKFKRDLCLYPLLLPGAGEQGGKTDRTGLSSLHLLCMSRTLTGVGSRKLCGELATIGTWSEYGKFLEVQLAKVA